MSLLRALREKLQGDEVGARSDLAAGGVLPDGNHVAVTWTIPDDPGGMTSALLRRSRAFARDTGRPVLVLTFDPVLDAARARARLESQGELADGVALRHLWEDLAARPDDRLGVFPDREPVKRARAEAGELVRTENDDAGRLVRRWHFRPDGTLAALEKMRPSGRAVRLFDRSGRQGHRWKSVWRLYQDWIDDLLPSGSTHLVVDSKSMVRFAAALDRPETSVTHVVHGAHLASSASDPQGPLSASRRSMISHLDDFGAVVFLTEGQRRDVVERVGARDHLWVVPNSTDLPAFSSSADRDRGSGAVVAALSDRKRVEQAVEGYGIAADRTGADLRLEIYGDGSRRDAVDQAAARSTGVTVHGYVPNAAEKLADASFLLLTSRSEGLPLVLAEAMSRGCLPIAYDVRYGPADFITHGVDGFLVPDGDVDGLARCIESLLRLDEDAVTAMRSAARANAERYSDEAVVALWADVFRRAEG